MGLFAVAVIISSFYWIISWFYKKARFIYERLTAIQGPAALPVIGNLHQFHFKPEGRSFLRTPKNYFKIRVLLSLLEKDEYNSNCYYILQSTLISLEFFEQAQGLAYLLRRSDERIVRVWLGGKMLDCIFD